MPKSKKKTVRILEQRLVEKLHSLSEQKECLFTLIESAIKPAITAAEELRLTEDGPDYEGRYLEVVGGLEHNLNALVLVTASAEQYLDPEDADSSKEESCPQASSSTSANIEVRETTSNIHIGASGLMAGQIIKVQVGHAEAPNKLWVRPAGPALCDLLKNMCAYYQSPGEIHQKMTLPEVGMICAVQQSLNNQFIRACVVSVPEVRNSEVGVFFVDDGNCQTLSANKLWYLPPMFKRLPGQAMPCALSEVYWTAEASEQVLQVVKSDMFSCVVLDNQNLNFPFVDLYFSNQEYAWNAGDTSLADVLIHRGIAYPAAVENTCEVHQQSEGVPCDEGVKGQYTQSAASDVPECEISAGTVGQDYEQVKSKTCPKLYFSESDLAKQSTLQTDTARDSISEGIENMCPAVGLSGNSSQEKNGKCEQVTVCDEGSNLGDLLVKSVNLSGDSPPRTRSGQRTEHSLPKTGSSEPKTEDNPPGSGENPSRSGNNPPITCSGQMAGDNPPKSGDNPPRTGLSTPKTGDSPRTGSSGQMAGDNPPRTGSSTPKTGDNPPRTGSSTPKTGDNPPRTGSSTPKTGDSPRTGSSGQMAGDNPPRTGLSTPKTGDSPRTGSSGQMAGDNPPKSGDNPPRTGSSGQMAGDNPPRTGSSMPKTGDSPRTGSSGQMAGDNPPKSGDNPPRTGSSGQMAGDNPPRTGSSGQMAGDNPPRTGSSMPKTGDSPRTGSSGQMAGDNPPKSGDNPPRTGSSGQMAGDNPPRTGSSGQMAGDNPPRTGSSMQKTGDNPPRTGSSMPKTGDNPPRTGSSTPKTGDSPRTGLSTPKTGDSPRTGSSGQMAGDNPPKSGDNPPRTGLSMPKTGDNPPRTGLSMPKTGDNPPRTGLSTPKTGDSPRTGSSGQMAGDNPPRTGSSGQMAGDNPPRTGSSGQMAGDNPPRTGSSGQMAGDSPRTGSSGQMAGDNPPKSGDNPPRTGLSTPKTGDNPPRTGLSMPKTGDNPPRTGLSMPKTGDSPGTGSSGQMAGDNPPRTGSSGQMAGDSPPRTGSSMPKTGDSPPRTCSCRPKTGDNKPNSPIHEKFSRLIKKLSLLVVKPPTVLLANINSPSEFFVHRLCEVTAQTLQVVEDCLQKYLSVLEQRKLPAHCSVSDLSFGSLCCGRYTKDNKLYRAMVMEITPEGTTKDSKNGEILITYLDFGNAESLPLSRLFPLPKECADLLAFPPAAVRCRLACISPPVSNNPSISASQIFSDNWENEAKQEFFLLTGYEKQFKMFIVPDDSEGNTCMSKLEAEDDDPVPVILVDESQLCINSELVEKGVACFVKPQPEVDDTWDPAAEERNSNNVEVDVVGVAVTGDNEVNICRVLQSAGECFRGRSPHRHVQPEDVYTQDKVAVCGSAGNETHVYASLPEENSWVEVEVTAIYNPKCFYVIIHLGDFTLSDSSIDSYSDPKDIRELLKELTEDMTSHYNASPFQEDKTVLPAIGKVVAAQYKDMWHRARVVSWKMEDPVKVQVFFLDYGYTEKVSLSRLRPLELKFLQSPFQAIECSLKGVEPVSGQKWSKEAISFFSFLAFGKPLAAFVSRRCDDTRHLKLKLFNNTTRNCTNIKKELCSAGYARPARDT